MEIPNEVFMRRVFFEVLLLLGFLFSIGHAEIFTPKLSYDWNRHSEKQNEFILDILDTEILSQLEDNGYSLSQLLGGSKKESNTADMYAQNEKYQNFSDTIGQSIPHETKWDQLPDIIPPNKGDIPETVRLLRGFEDKGKRSEKDLTGGFIIRKLSNNSQHPYSVEYDGDEPRHFDYRWLNSKLGHFKLIAVVNRMDRLDFDSKSCGEIRFIFRLSYNSSKSGSSLPFFVNVVQSYPEADSCKAFAKLWQVSFEQSQSWKNAGADGIKKFVEHLKSKPFKNLTFKQLELNMQSLRFTSGYMHDFGGQAMYMQRIFKIKNDKLESIELENTPDVLEIEKNPVLLEKFVDFLKQGDRLEKLDQGILNINFDSRFLAKRAVSWSTLGRVRTANKPYSRLFEKRKDLLKTIDISKLQYIKTHDGLIERLNNLTCMGCHQSGGTAGFHMLGFPDKQFSHGFNRQALPFSQHVYGELARRNNYLTALVEGRAPNSFRPHSHFPVAKWSADKVIPSFEKAHLGQLCLLSPSHFQGGLDCAAGLRCLKTIGLTGKEVLFGECVNVVKPLAGSVCWEGDVKETSQLPADRGEIPAYNFFAFQDKWKLTGSAASNKNYRCVLPQSGAPLGRSTRACTLEEENFSKIKLQADAIPDELCANQGGNGFDLCAASGDSGSCLESRVVRSNLDTCYPGKFCREDYICQKLPDYHKISDAHYMTKKEGKRVNLSVPKDIDGKIIQTAQENHIGFCVPTYFLFNMRLDGHTSPITGLPPGEPKFDRSQPLRGYKK